MHDWMKVRVNVYVFHNKGENISVLSCCLSWTSLTMKQTHMVIVGKGQWLFIWHTSRCRFIAPMGESQCRTHGYVHTCGVNRHKYNVVSLE